MKREHTFGLAVAGLGALLLYLLNKKGLLHESVTSSILSGHGTTRSDPATGYPQYDTREASTVPAEEAFAVEPIDTNGNITQFPKDIFNCTCPVGFQKWRNAADGSIWCLPVPVMGGPSIPIGAPLT